jgi:chorismate mutase / prephenate dehydratase
MKDETAVFGKQDDMSTQDPTPNSLEDIRREIDGLDDQIVDLLAKRFDVTSHVLGLKKQSIQIWPSPLRPTREALILRRLVGRAKETRVSPELLVRLWRGILNDSTRKQQELTLHVSKHLNNNLGHRLALRDYFGAMKVEEYRDEAQALFQIDSEPQDLCVIETGQNWVEAFLNGAAGKAQVIASLPAIKDEAAPQLLIFGNAPVEPTGEDETLVITEGKLPRDFAPQPLWQMKVGAHRLSSLPGFLTEHEGPLVGLTRSNASLGLKIAGRFASAIEVSL